MLRKICLSLTCLTTILLVGCASTTIYPEGNNNYSLVTTSSDQGAAEKDAAKKAGEYCAQLGKQLIVVSHKTAYQGANKDNAAVIGLASAVLTGGANPATSNQDYQVSMKFTCK